MFNFDSSEVNCMRFENYQLTGHPNSVKCLVDEESGRHLFTRCAAHILENTSLKHPVDSVVNTAVQAYHKSERCGTNTMIMMIMLWTKKLNLLIEQGLPCSAIVEGAQSALTFCLNHLESVSINIDLFMCTNEHNKSDGSTVHFYGADCEGKIHDSSNITGTDYLPSQCELDVKETENQMYLKLESEDDIGWFFENGEVPELPQLGSLCISAAEFNQNSSKFKTALFDRDETIQQETKYLIADERTDDEDFLDCFDGTAHIECIAEKSRKSNACHSAKVEDINEKLKTLLAKKREKQRAVTLNRSRHFTTVNNFVDELKTRNNAQPAIVKSTLECKPESYHESSDDFLEIEFKNEKSAIDIVKSTPDRHPQNGKLQIEIMESKLEEILISKKHQSKVNTDKIFNRSRHFTNMSSCVTEMQHRLNGIHTVEKKGSAPVANVPNGNPESDLLLIQTYVRSCDVPNNLNYFSPNHNTVNFLFDNETNTKSDTEIYLNQLAVLCEYLSHGHYKLGYLCFQVLKSQLSKSTYPSARLDLSRIHVVCNVGPLSKYSRVVEGLVLESSPFQLTVLSRKSTLHRALLVNGDLQFRYRHTGFRQPQKHVKIKQRVGDGVSPDEHWLQQTILTIKNLKVTLLLVRGAADRCVIDACHSCDIAVISDVNYHALLAMAEITDAEMLNYINSASETNVAVGVKAECLQSSWLCQMGPAVNKSHILVTVPSNLIQTVVLCHPCESVCRLHEETFWHVGSRISHVLSTGRALQGAGQTESHCSRQLQEEADRLEQLDVSDCTAMYRPVVYRAMAEALYNFKTSLSNEIFDGNNDCHCEANANISVNVAADKIFKAESQIFKHFSNKNNDNETAAFLYETVATRDVLDDYQSKVAGWQASLHVSLQIILADFEIITGQGDHKIKPSQNIITKDTLALL